MKINQKGFGTLEGVLILVIVGLISFIGWYAYNTNKKMDADETTVGKVTSQPVAKTEASLKTYMSTELPLTFKYPEGWKTTETPSAGGTFVIIKKPGTVKGTMPIGSEYVKSGAEIAFLKHAAIGYSNVSEFNASGIPQSNGTNKKNLTVDGREGMEYDLSYEGPETHEVIFFDNSSYYMVIMEQSVYKKAEYAKIFNNLVSSIKFQ